MYYVDPSMFAHVHCLTVRPGEHVEGAVAQESDIDVVTEGQQPQRVAQQS